VTLIRYSHHHEITSKNPVSSAISMASMRRLDVARRIRATSLLMATTTVAVTVALVTNEIMRLPLQRRRKRSGRRKFRTTSISVLRSTSHFTEFEFSACFRMNRRVFRVLLNTLEPYIQCDSEMGRRSSGCAISPSTRLAVALRILAGASYVDVYFAFRVSVATAYANTHYIAGIIQKAFALPGIPFSEETKLASMARAFTQSRRSPLFGCMGALDGILIPIQKPPDHLSPRKYFCRKGYYAIPLQVVCDSSYRFLFLSGRTAGATHDSLAYSVSILHEALANNSLPDGYWIAGDEAYLCSNSLLTPWPSSLAKDDSAKDAFNFYQSSLRIHIEQAFGQLVRRFGLLWKPIQFSIRSVLSLVHACMCIHNLIIDERGSDEANEEMSALVQNEGRGAAEFAEWWSRTTASEGFRGRRRDLERSELRERLTEVLRVRGDTRPQ
jgi:DDE superfamily endonuclease